MGIQRKQEEGPGRRTPRPCRTTGAAMRRPGLVGALAASLLLGALILPPEAATASPDQLVPVIVRGQRGSVDVAERLVLDAGGTVGRRISIIDGFAAKVPSTEIAGLNRSPAIVSVTPDASVRLLGTVDGIDPNKHPGSWLKVAKNTKLYEMWQRGWTGEGVDVALIDSGVAPLPGIDLQVINGPDLSFDSQAPNLTRIRAMAAALFSEPGVDPVPWPTPKPKPTKAPKATPAP